MRLGLRGGSNLAVNMPHIKLSGFRLRVGREKLLWILNGL